MLAKIKRLFSECSTCGVGTYYPTKGHAINRFDGILQGFDLCLDRNDLDFPNDCGVKSIAVIDEFKHVKGYARISWHRMDTGRYEVIGYIG